MKIYISELILITLELKLNFQAYPYNVGIFFTKNIHSIQYCRLQLSN